MADCLIYESRLLIEDALEDSSPFFTSSFSRSSWSLSAQATAVLESRHLSEQFELNMQLLGMEAYPEQREFVAYIEDSLQQPLPSFIEAPTGIGKTYAYLLTLLAKTSKRILVSVPTKFFRIKL